MNYKNFISIWDLIIYKIESRQLRICSAKDELNQNINSWQLKTNRMLLSSQ